jgi:hypothetical protein
VRRHRHRARHHSLPRVDRRARRASIGTSLASIGIRPPAVGRERPHRHHRDQCRRRARPASGRASGRAV